MMRVTSKNDDVGSQKGRKGFTLVEVTIAMAIAVLISAGLYTMGLHVRRSANHNRLATEARAFAEERLEMIVATGVENLAKPSNTLLEESSFMSQIKSVVTQTPRVAWYTADRSASAAGDADYAEVHIDVTYRSQHRSAILTNTYSILIY